SSPALSAADTQTPLTGLTRAALETPAQTVRPGDLTRERSGDLSRNTPAPVAHDDGRPGLGSGPLIPLTPMRRAIAEHLATAFATIPHGQTVMVADLTTLVAWRDQHKRDFQQTEGANLTF